MNAQLDFHLFENWRGWACVLPLTRRAHTWAMLYLEAEARAWAEEFGQTSEERRSYWFDPRDGLDVVRAFVADGLTCANCHTFQHQRFMPLGQSPEEPRA